MANGTKKILRVENLFFDLEISQDFPISREILFFQNFTHNNLTSFKSLSFKFPKMDLETLTNGYPSVTHSTNLSQFSIRSLQISDGSVLTLSTLASSGCYKL